MSGAPVAGTQPGQFSTPKQTRVHVVHKPKTVFCLVTRGCDLLTGLCSDLQDGDALVAEQEDKQLSRT